MSIDYFQLLKQTHANHNPERFIQVDAFLVESIGLIPATVFAAINFKLKGLLDPRNSTCKKIIANENWFYVHQSELTELTGLKQQTVSDAVSKLVSLGILQKKHTNTIPKINMYRQLEWSFDFSNMNIISNNPYVSLESTEQDNVSPCNPHIPVPGINKPVPGVHNARTIDQNNNNKDIKADGDPDGSPCAEEQRTNTVSTLGSANTPRRRSIPRQKQQIPSKTETKEIHIPRKKKTPQELPNDKIYYHAETLYNLIYQWHPKSKNSMTWDSCKHVWYKTLSKIRDMCPANEKRNFFEAILWVWTCDDESAAFFRTNFRGVPALRNLWKKGTKNEREQWTDILLAYKRWKLNSQTREQRNAPIEDQIENIVTDTITPRMKQERCPRSEIEEEISETMIGIRKVLDRLDRISNSLQPKNQFVWHKTKSVLQIIPWFLDLDQELIRNKEFWPFENFIDQYLDHLEAKMQRGYPRTLYPKLFSWEEDMLVKFLGQLYEDVGPITKTQRREELPWV